MANILTEIVDYKREIEIPRQRQYEPLSELEQRVAGVVTPLDFEGALRKAKSANRTLSEKVALIAEVKKASPSKGLLCPNFDPAQLAAAYLQAGASALSVLTDEKFFMGHLDYIAVCKKATNHSVPILRKDFVIDPYQVVQARAYGADAILLIMACLQDGQAKELFELAYSLKMAVLVEVHDAYELERALKLGARVIGVNNRDLNSFKVDLQTTATVAGALPADFHGVLVSESGIGSYTEISGLAELGVNAVLIGETLVRAASTDSGLDADRIVQKVQELFAGQQA